MASSKSKKPTSKAAPKKPVSAKKPTGATKPRLEQESVAVATLGSLPALTGKLRAAFRLAFSDEQCDAWGALTRAEDVIKEAQRWIGIMAGALKDGADVTYSRRRLTFLCELLVLLEDELAYTKNSANVDLRCTRNAALAVANNARKDLTRRLRALAGGQEKLLREVDRLAPGRESSATDVQDSLTATIDLGLKMRRSEIMEALADDVGLTEARLNSAYAALEALAGARSITLEPVAQEGDAPSVNRIEGRVLREMRLAQQLFDEARTMGAKVPPLRVGPTLKGVLERADAIEAAAPTPPVG